MQKTLPKNKNPDAFISDHLGGFECPVCMLWCSVCGLVCVHRMFFMLKTDRVGGVCMRSF